MAAEEPGLAFQYKQGVGLVNQIPFVVMSKGDYRVAKKIIGKPGWLSRQLKHLGINYGINYAYTGFQHKYASWLTSENKYLGVFDYDTDIQLDIVEVFRSIQQRTNVTPEEKVLEDKLMAGSIWRAAEKTREMRTAKSWIEKYGIYLLWGFLFLTTILSVYFYFHLNPKLVQVQVQFLNGTYNSYTGNGIGGGIGQGVVQATNSIISGGESAISHIP